jgi:hypothetical protein
MGNGRKIGAILLSQVPLHRISCKRFLIITDQMEVPQAAPVQHFVKGL